MDIKKTILVLGLISTIVYSGTLNERNDNVLAAVPQSIFTSQDRFELVQTVNTVSNEVLTTDNAFKDFEYYNNDLYVLLHDNYSGYYNGPVASEVVRIKTYGRNNEYSVQAGELCAIYKDPNKYYTHLVDGLDRVNPSYESIGFDLKDNYSSSISVTVSSRIGGGFGDFVEAGISYTLSYEFGMEVGSSLGATFTFTNSFKNSYKTFSYDLYEVHSRFLIVRMKPTIKLTQSKYKEKYGPFNLLTREVTYNSGYYVEYKKEIYLFDTVSQMAFDYDVNHN